MLCIFQNEVMPTSFGFHVHALPISLSNPHLTPNRSILTTHRNPNPPYSKWCSKVTLALLPAGPRVARWESNENGRISHPDTGEPISVALGLLSLLGLPLASSLTAAPHQRRLCPWNEDKGQRGRIIIHRPITCMIIRAQAHALFTHKYGSWLSFSI